MSGCDNPAPIAAKHGAPKVEHPATITGRIFFAGSAPSLPPLDTSAVSACHHPGGIPDESVVVNANGTLANVVVYLKGVATFDASAQPPAVLDQVNCQYVPHVVAVQVGQTLTLKNSDPFLHNVHIADATPPLNLAFTRVQQRDVAFDRPGFLKTRCDVHPWMTAWVAVFDHPCFAVTGGDGSFTLANVPPGTYTLEAWHERFGTISQSLTAGPDGIVKCEMTYR
jgi:plastocyanin